MPSYVSHAIMAEELHNRLKINGIKTIKSSIKLSSLIPDLASKKTNNHNSNTEDYILFLIKYIKDNKLFNNSEVLSMLYGIISHYYLDTYTHPFIYNIDFNSKNNSMIRSHHYIEGYLNYYLAEKVLKKNILLVDPEYSTNGKLSLKNKIILDLSYKKIYGIDIMSTIKSNLYNIKLLEFAYKKIVKNNKLLAKCTGFDSFMKLNHFTEADIDNRNNNEWMNPFTSQISNKSFIELYEESIIACTDTINLINCYFNDEVDFDKLTGIFNKSYDTGTIHALKKKK